MSFFRDFLKRQQQVPDLDFEEDDENWFVFALVLLRLGFGHETWNLITGRGQQFRNVDPLRRMSPSLDFENALNFVSMFLCFFVPKPPRYRREIASFKSQYIPDFSANTVKLESVLPSFLLTPLEEAKWEKVSEYFRVQSNETPRSQEAAR